MGYLNRENNQLAPLIGKSAVTVVTGWRPL